MKRPLNVTILSVLVLIQGGVFVLFASVTLGLFSVDVSEALPPDVAAEIPEVSVSMVLLASASLVMGVVGLVSGVGILLLRSWAWLMAMIAQGINLFAELLNYTQGDANYLSMLVSTLVVLYLNQRDVQQTFSVAQQRIDPASVRAAEADQAAMAALQREMAESKYKDMRQ